MRSFPANKLTLFAAVALIGFDSNYLARGGPAAPIWLAGAAAGHPAVTATRVNGRGRDGAPAAWNVAVVTTGRAEDLGTDVSTRERLTWGCGGDAEWREVETGSMRLTARLVEICGTHRVGEDDGEVRVNVRADHLVLNNAVVTAVVDGYVDVRARRLTLRGESRLESVAKRSGAPPFATSANLSVSAEEIEGPGHLTVTSVGADYGRE